MNDNCEMEGTERAGWPDGAEEHLRRVAEAFSRKAMVYDAFGAGHTNLERMRRKVIDHIGRLHPSGSSLLELNAGTGQDAVTLVQRGYRVHATDVAPGMVGAIEEKIGRYKLHGRLTSQTCSFMDLSPIGDRCFDGVFSNLGGMNCTSDLRQVGGQVARLLRPGGFVTLVVMPRICPWELAHLAQDWGVATRRLHRNGVLASVSGVEFVTTYHSVQSVKRAFGGRFRQVDLEGLSVITPTADNNEFAARHPRLFGWLARVDDQISRWPVFNGWGDFFILSMQLTG